MALQGTLETFSVPEVLRLLAGTKKTGLLALEGDRGVGNVWLTDGRISTARSEHEQGDRIEPVLFDLLRFEAGSFVFEPGSRPDEDPAHDADVEEALTEAERLLEEWRDIESVVPSLDVHVRLVEQLRGESVTVTADQWKSLVLIGSGTSARRIGATFDLGEFDACNLVRTLVEAGLVDVTEDDVPVPVADVVPAVDGVVDHDLSHDEVASLGHNLAGFVATPQSEQDDQDEQAEPAFEEIEAAHDPVAELDDTSGFDEPEDDLSVSMSIDDDDEVVDEPEFAPEPEPFVAAPSDEATPEPEDFLSQLSSLSPKAAAAIEATAETGGDMAETDTPPAPVGGGEVDGDEEINRNLLLKFLSSAKN